MSSTVSIGNEHVRDAQRSNVKTNRCKICGILAMILEGKNEEGNKLHQSIRLEVILLRYLYVGHMEYQHNLSNEIPNIKDHNTTK